MREAADENVGEESGDHYHIGTNFEKHVNILSTSTPENRGVRAT